MDPDLLLTELFSTGEEEVALHLVEELGMSVKSVNRLRRSWPNLFHRPLNELQAVVSYLSSGTNECKRNIERTVVANTRVMCASV